MDVSALLYVYVTSLIFCHLMSYALLEEWAKNLIFFKILTLLNPRIRTKSVTPVKIIFFCNSVPWEGSSTQSKFSSRISMNFCCLFFFGKKSFVNHVNQHINSEIVYRDDKTKWFLSALPKKQLVLWWMKAPELCRSPKPRKNIIVLFPAYIPAVLPRSYG